MKISLTYFILFLTFFSLPTFASYKIQMVRGSLGTQVVSVQKSRIQTAKGQRILLRSLPRFLDEGPRSSREMFQEYLADDSLITPQLKQFTLSRMSLLSIPGAELKSLVQQGPTENRINLTIVGDGYTMGEKDKFFADALRTTKELFTGHTFASYLPLFNVFAVFVPSHVSGIGDGSPKDTALKLYRSPQGSKRAIMPGDPRAADAALALAPATDFPILLANDNYYGGLGGQYAISTSSPRSGMIVLRHELGHNFGSVGEEYDGGYVYTGANFSSSANAPWSYWADEGFKVNEALNLGGDYMWQNLTGHPISMDFNFPAPTPQGPFALSILVSSVGWETPGDVLTTVDGNTVPLKGEYNDDRNFYEIGPTNQMPPGKHVINFSEKIQDGDNVLAYVRIYAHAPGYDFTPGKVGAYAAFDDSGRKVGYRPTHDACLMRNMLTPNFCVVDKENMWLRFLDRISLIDGVVVGRDHQVTLNTPKLPGMNVAWYKTEGGKEQELTQYHGQFSWPAPAALTGSFKVRVQFATPEVRKYSGRFKADKDFTL